MIGGKPPLLNARVLVDGREIPNVIGVDRNLVFVVERDRAGRPIADGKGGYAITRRAGKIEVIEKRR